MYHLRNKHIQKISIYTKKTHKKTKLKEININEHQTWDTMKNTIIKIAEETVGRVNPAIKRHQVHNEEVKRLSQVQQELRLKADNTKGEESSSHMKEMYV